MKTYKKSSKSKIDLAKGPGGFFKTYFIILIISAVLSIVDIFFVSGRLNFFSIKLVPFLALWIFFLSLLELAVFVLSVIAVIKFIKRKIYLALIAPIFYFVSLFLFVFLFSFNLYFTSEGFFNPTVLVLAIIINIFLLAFSIFILSKYR